MVQREVAERLAAGPGSRVYGIPSVIARLYATPRLWRFGCRPPSSIPGPTWNRRWWSWSGTNRLPMPPRPPRLAATAFGQRRKMLRRSLAGALPEPESVLAAAGIDPRSRPEDLDVAAVPRPGRGGRWLSGARPMPSPRSISA